MYFALSNLPELKAHQGCKGEDQQHKQNTVGVEYIFGSLGIANLHVVPEYVSRLVGFRYSEG